MCCTMYAPFSDVAALKSANVSGANRFICVNAKRVALLRAQTILLLYCWWLNMKLNSINKDQRIYVINNGANSVSCYGFDNLNNMAVTLLGWMNACGVDITTFTIPSRVGTKKHFIACDAVICAARHHAVSTQTRCDAFLSDQLVGKEGDRVEVVDATGMKRRFYVGRSTGWMPSHLEIATRRSYGGVAVFGSPFRSVVVVG
ncbi:DNA A-C-terminal domain containing protein [Pectobacterium phage MA12]|uniref:DNA A-C-terminal domain containing protein n=1 Tax=Pectobacterium phage MA12 TaxID=2686474 RepID=A0A6B9RH09_9CAUD|nr:hypothetical protein JT356_gp04 [Pectobacterium phage MA11]YP_010000238.1 DNA A-C-terminal domain containing protein [Pectobacterium phage MA12]QGF21029.1 hypothetical protein MA11_gp04 [Pectobacterium phage MA11]QHI00843.1 DNA A-C-terminal domain containing protein [Pectobacterium phage MA12]